MNPMKNVIYQKRSEKEKCLKTKTDGNFYKNFKNTLEKYKN